MSKSKQRKRTGANAAPATAAACCAVTLLILFLAGCAGDPTARDGTTAAGDGCTTDGAIADDNAASPIATVDGPSAPEEGSAGPSAGADALSALDDGAADSGAGADGLSGYDDGAASPGAVADGLSVPDDGAASSSAGADGLSTPDAPSAGSDEALDPASVPAMVDTFPSSSKIAFDPSQDKLNTTLNTHSCYGEVAFVLWYWEHKRGEHGPLTSWHSDEHLAIADMAEDTTWRDRSADFSYIANHGTLRDLLIAELSSPEAMPVILSCALGPDVGAASHVVLVYNYRRNVDGTIEFDLYEPDVYPDWGGKHGLMTCDDSPDTLLVYGSFVDFGIAPPIEHPEAIEFVYEYFNDPPRAANEFPTGRQGESPSVISADIHYPFISHPENTDLSQYIELQVNGDTVEVTCERTDVHHLRITYSPASLPTGDYHVYVESHCSTALCRPDDPFDDVPPFEAEWTFSIESPVWFESWETAPIGHKTETDVFASDGGAWTVDWLAPGKIRVCSNGQWCGTTIEVSEDRRLVIHSLARAPFDRGANCMICDRTEGSLWAKPLPAPAVGGAHSLLPIPAQRLPLTEDTTFSGSFACQVQIEYEASTVEAFAHIQIDVPGFSLIYLHENCVGGEVDLESLKTIRVSDRFERHIYSDLVRMFGQEFVDSYESLPEEMRSITSVHISGEAAAPSFGQVAECKCYIDDLRIADNSE